MKEKGFTLMELLAVIVILAIIALIATPMILGVIDSAKKGAAESSIAGYINAVEQYYVSSMMENEEFPTSINELNEVVEVKGTKPSRGTIAFTEEGVIGTAVFCINNFYVDYSNGKARVNTEKNCNEIENLPNQPKLEANMIPVVYENGTWVKANKLEKWYDYDAQMWANAVTVTETNRENYLSAEAGTEIKMEDINLMMVWVPRYEYKIEGEFGKGGTSASSPGEIEVSFVSGRSNTASEGYTVHPGFTFGNKELTGMWIGKFETGRVTGNGIADDSVDNVVVVKPNISSWRSNRIATAFEATRKMELANNPYGFAQTGTTYNTDGFITGDSNKIDTHMTRNTEWTAVAYLSQSKYGKYGNSNYTGANKEVYMNNHSGYQTGCSAGTPSAASSDSCANAYNVMGSNGSGAGVGASTTGNIYGIYDMNGGAWERVMANYNHMSGYTAISYTAAQAKTILGRTDNAAVGVWNSGFNGPVYGKALDGVTPLEWTTGVPFPNEKYYDYYGTTDRNTACNGGKCIGHNTSEASGWYGDYAIFVSAMGPWLVRGGYRYDSAGVGVFAISYNYGYARSYDSFRIVLSIE